VRPGKGNSKAKKSWGEKAFSRIWGGGGGVGPFRDSEKGIKVLGCVNNAKNKKKGEEEKILHEQQKLKWGQVVLEGEAAGGAKTEFPHKRGAKVATGARGTRKETGRTRSSETRKKTQAWKDFTRVQTAG